MQCVVRHVLSCQAFGFQRHPQRVTHTRMLSAISRTQLPRLNTLSGLTVKSLKELKKKKKSVLVEVREMHEA